jgi:CspA family cold shock protein
MAERETGTVKWFNNQKGFGFITRDSGGDVCVHYSALSGQGFRSLVEGERVEFAVEQAEKGPAAVDVRKV